jgi:uncharacterized protein YdaU (DUF1376 family)
MNYYEHHIGDYIKATAHLSMLEDAAYRRLIDAYYTKEAPLPADRKACHRLTRATSKPERDAVDTILDEFFTLADDGWHQSRCDEEIAKYVEKRPAAEEKREHDKERQRRARERRKQLFEELARHGISLPFNSTTEALQAEVSRVTNRDQSQPVTQPVTRDNTLTQTPVPRHQSPDSKPHSVVEFTEPQPESPEPPPENATRKGALCRQLRVLGIEAAPHLTAWADLLSRFSDQEILAAAETAREKKPGERLSLNYLVPILNDRKTPRSQTHDRNADRAATVAEFTGSNRRSEPEAIDGIATRVA